MPPWGYSGALANSSSSSSSSAPESRYKPPWRFYAHPEKGSHTREGDDGDSNTSQDDDGEEDEGSLSDSDSGGEADEGGSMRSSRKSNTSIEIGVGVLILLLIVAAGIFAYFKFDTSNGESSQGNQPSSTSESQITLASTAELSSASQTQNSESATSNAPFSAAGSTTTPPASETGNVTSTTSPTMGSANSSASSTNGTNTGPYKLITDCSGTSFWDCWDFFTDSDPTHGQVTFVDQSTASSAGLISATSTSAIMRADNTTNLASGANRNSIRLTSKDAVAIGSLMVLDVIAMPWGCATWPAWWTVGADATWPDGGEIDIIEGVNLNTQNQYTLHVSSSDCKPDSSATTLGTAGGTDCNAADDGNAGCSYHDTSTSSYGQGLNAAGGGVFATLFVPAGISIWFWARADIPADISSPDASTWGTPAATWPTTTCDMSTYFTSQSMVFDLTLCGDWAGAVWSGDCASAASTCSAYVATGSNFDNAVWEIGSVRVYTVPS